MTGPSLSLIFRAAAQPDLKAIVTLDKKCFGEDAWSAKDYKPYLTDGPYLKNVFLLAGMPKSPDLAGSCLGVIDTLWHVGFIYDLAVDGAYRGQGLGRELLDRVCASLRELGAEVIKLEVETTNTSAIHLYETSGFENESTIPDYYGEGRDAFNMVKWDLAARP